MKSVLENVWESAWHLTHLGLFWTLAAIFAQFLPPTGAAVVEVIFSTLLLTGAGSIAVSVVLGGDGFDYPGSGFVLGLAGFLFVHFVFKWHLTLPYNHAGVVIFKEHTDEIFGMLWNLWKVAVGMAIVAVPTLPIMWKLRKSRD